MRAWWFAGFCAAEGTWILLERTPINDEAFRFSTQLLQTLYAIMVVLGFEELGNGIYLCLFEKDDASGLHVPIFLSVLAVTSFGVRFFWGVNNIERTIRSCTEQRKGAHVAIMIASVSALLLQALLIYLMAKQTHRFVDGMTLLSLAQPFARTGSALLLLNGVWLALLHFYSARTLPKEWFWAKNNICFALVLGLLQVVGATSLNDWWLLVVANLLFLLNAAIDIYRTANYYFGFGDQVGEAPAPSPPLGPTEASPTPTEGAAPAGP